MFYINYIMFELNAIAAYYIFTVHYYEVYPSFSIEL